MLGRISVQCFAISSSNISCQKPVLLYYVLNVRTEQKCSITSALNLQRTNTTQHLHLTCSSGITVTGTYVVAHVRRAKRFRGGCYSFSRVNQEQIPERIYLPATCQQHEKCLREAVLLYQWHSWHRRGGGAAWKLPSVSITHQKPALKYHYSCTSQFASSVTSEMTSGSQCKSQKERNEKRKVLPLTTANKGGCKTWTDILMAAEVKFEQPFKIQIYNTGCMCCSLIVSMQC